MQQQEYIESSLYGFLNDIGQYKLHQVNISYESLLNSCGILGEQLDFKGLYGGFLYMMRNYEDKAKKIKIICSLLELFSDWSFKYDKFYQFMMSFRLITGQLNKDLSSKQIIQLNNNLLMQKNILAKIIQSCEYKDLNKDINLPRSPGFQAINFIKSIIERLLNLKGEIASDIVKHKANEISKFIIKNKKLSDLLEIIFIMIEDLNEIIVTENLERYNFNHELIMIKNLKKTSLIIKSIHITTKQICKYLLQGLLSNSVQDLSFLIQLYEANIINLYNSDKKNGTVIIDNIRKYNSILILSNTFEQIQLKRIQPYIYKRFGDVIKKLKKDTLKILLCAYNKFQQQQTVVQMKVKYEMLVDIIKLKDQFQKETPQEQFELFQKIISTPALSQILNPSNNLSMNMKTYLNINEFILLQQFEKPILIYYSSKKYPQQLRQLINQLTYEQICKHLNVLLIDLNLHDQTFVESIYFALLERLKFEAYENNYDYLLSVVPFKHFNRILQFMKMIQLSGRQQFNSICQYCQTFSYKNSICDYCGNIMKFKKWHSFKLNYQLKKLSSEYYLQIYQRFQNLRSIDRSKKARKQIYLLVLDNYVDSFYRVDESY